MAIILYKPYTNGNYSAFLESDKLCFWMKVDKKNQYKSIHATYNLEILVLDEKCVSDWKGRTCHDLKALSMLSNVNLVDALPSDSSLYIGKSVTAHKVSQLPLNISKRLADSTHILINEKTIKCILEKVSMFRYDDSYIFVRGLNNEKLYGGERIVNVIHNLIDVPYMLTNSKLEQYRYEASAYVLVSSNRKYTNIAFTLACMDNATIITEESLIRHNSFIPLDKNILTNLYEMALSKDVETRTHCLRMLSQYDYLSYPKECQKIALKARRWHKIPINTATLFMIKLLSLLNMKLRKGGAQLLIKSKTRNEV